MSSSMKHHRRWRIPPAGIWGCAVAIATLFAGCSEEKKEATHGTPNQASPGVSVVVAPVVQKTVPLITELTARTDATDTVEIRARVKAFLLKQNYTEGTMVKAGQVLFVLDKREYEAQLLQAEAQMAK